LLVVSGFLAPGFTRAHTTSTASVISKIAADDMKQAVGVVSVATNPNLERLLVVRVSARWHEADEGLRRHLAQEWRHLWRDAISDGIVAVVDDDGGNSLVGYDLDGRATLRAQPKESETAAD
jgi:hypothetical protein